MKISIVYVTLFGLFFTLSTMTLSGCGKSGNGLATDHGSMTMEEFQKLKADDEKAIAEGMQKEVGKKP